MEIGDVGINPFNWNREEAQSIGNFGAYLSGFHFGTVREQVIPIEHNTKEVVLRKLKGLIREYPGFDLVVKDKTSGRQLAHTRLYITPDGETLVYGPYTKEIHAGLSKAGIKRPTAYFIDAKRFQFLPDKILYGEFDNFFLDTSPSIPYKPATFYFYRPDTKTFFERAAVRFFGDGVEAGRFGFQERWRRQGTEIGPWLPRLGNYQMVKGPIKLRGGFELEPTGTFQNWHMMNADFHYFNELEFFRPEEKVTPPPFAPNEVVIVETKGQAAPRSIEAKTTHRLFHIKGADGRVTTIAQEMSRTVYHGVNTFLITHPHADHLDPVTMLKQLTYNKANGGTTLILGEEAKTGVLHTLAEYDGWEPNNHMGTAEEFLTKKYTIKVVPEMTVGDFVVRATPDVMGAHGVPVNGVGIFKRSFDPGEVGILEKLLYYDPSDGDYNIDSLQKQINTLTAKPGQTSADPNQLTRLHQVKEYLLEARYVTVDQGTTGLDTHGTAKTTENLRRERLKQKFRMPDDMARAVSGAFSRDGRAGALQALAKSRWEEDAIKQMHIVDELEAVSDTSHLGAGGEKRNVPEYREGRLESIGADGSRRIELPHIKQELQKVGLKLVAPFNSSFLGDSDFLHIEIDGVIFHVRNKKDVPHKLARLMREYSTTIVEKVDGQVVKRNVVTLRQMTVTEGRQTRLVGEWLKQKGIYVIVKTPGRPAKTPLGYYDLPQRSTIPGLRNRITYRMIDSLKVGLNIFDPKTAYYSRSLVGGVLKYGGPALMAASLASVIHTNWEELEYGSPGAIAEVLATVASFGLSFWVFGVDLAATAVIVGVASIHQGSLQEGWESVHTIALPLSTSFHWLAKQGLTWGIRKIQNGI